MALLAAAGCTVEGGGSVDVDVFDPIGGDVSVDALWTINGQPASAATCAEIGASTVVLEVWDSSRGNFYTEAAWEVACASGGFVTGPVLFPDTYDLRFVAYDAAGVEVLATDYARVTALAGDIIEVTGNFVGTVAPTEATLSGSWEIDGVTADAASCAAAGIDEVVLSIANDAAGTDIYVEYVFDCAQGSFDARSDSPEVTIPIGPMYFSQWYAEAADDSVLAESDWLELQVVSPTTHANLAVPNFPGGTTLIVNLFWETGLGTGIYGTCADAAVDTMGYELYLGDTAIVSDFGGACANQLIFDDPAADIYELDVSGDATDGTKWGITCTGLSVSSGMVTYDCDVDVQP
ncbi:MAG: hypothetical protein CMN30_18975 [Sandaracinus sp.]|nr:hypothetical protein [Sandaracinus sp.]